MTYEVSEGAAYAVLYTVLFSFTIIAFIASGWFGTSPLLEKLGCILLPKTSTMGAGKGEIAHSESIKQLNTADYFLSARNSAGARSIALSFFASGMGAWVVYGSTEMGANPDLSWLGVLGYSAASGLPALIICWIGPRVREISGEKAFATTDFGRERYGRLMQLSIAAISVFYSEFSLYISSLLLRCLILYYPYNILSLIISFFFLHSVHLPRVGIDINLECLWPNRWSRYL